MHLIALVQTVTIKARKLKDIVASRKKEVKDVMGRLEDQVVRAHFEAKAAWDAGATKEEMEPALMDIRHAQWRWDYAAASHGGHMHAPDVMLRVLWFWYRQSSGCTC